MLTAVQPFSLRAAALFIGTGLILVGYFQYEKARLERKRVVEMSKGYGKPKVGGPFTLQDLDGKEVTEKDLLGKYSIIYFGFTHCPDICPDELDKLSAAIDILNANPSSANTFRSIFMSVDPARDTPAVLKSYLAEFHPQIQGLTGTWQQIKDTCKAYRVYFSTPQDLKPGEEDYLVDHSIYFYVMDPEGDFVECIGRQDTPESAAGIILEHIKDWRKDGKKIDQTPLQFKNEAAMRTSQGRSSEIGGVANRANAPA
ncbi:Cu-binding protein [Lithohypha guttulata]|uniref:Cu-binding protein n=1 Tax=Lithohypha guttulata TaxID=1690604 RepID=UPI002DE0C2D0|nr:Cu-binding protein [Lithohypha guttulata]